MNNSDNLIDITSDISTISQLQSALNPLFDEANQTNLDSIHRHLLTLPILLPFELDQLLDDNDAFIDVIHGLLKVNRSLDVIPYFNRLNDNLIVLSHHYEVYSRSFQGIPIFTDDIDDDNVNVVNNNDIIDGNSNNEHQLPNTIESNPNFLKLVAPLQRLNQTSNQFPSIIHPVDSTQQEQQEQSSPSIFTTTTSINSSTMSSTTTTTPSQSSTTTTSIPSNQSLPNFYAINIVSLYYIQQQIQRAEELLTLFKLHDISLSSSDQMKFAHDSSYRQIYAPWGKLKQLQPLFSSKQTLSFNQWRNLLQVENENYQQYDWYQQLLQQRQNSWYNNNNQSPSTTTTTSSTSINKKKSTQISKTIDTSSDDQQSNDE